jgi:hypothetical protein
MGRTKKKMFGGVHLTQSKILAITLMPAVVVPTANHQPLSMNRYYEILH